ASTSTHGPWQIAATGLRCAMRSRTNATRRASARSLSAPTVPPGITTASNSSAFSPSAPSCASSVSPGSRSWRFVVTGPASLDTSTASAPASRTASSGFTSSSCSVPLGATRNATRLPVRSVAIGTSSLGPPRPATALGAARRGAPSAARRLAARRLAAGLLADRLLGQHGLHVRLDAHLVRYQHPARLERLVPLQAPVAAVDLAGGLEAHPLLAPRVDAAALEQHVERDLLGGVGDLEVTHHAEARALLGLRPERLLAAEDDLGVVLGVEEVGAAEVAVTVGHAGVEARGLDVHLRPGGVGRLPVQVQPPVEAREAPADGGEHHVLGRELDRGVSRVDLPDANCHGWSPISGAVRPLQYREPAGGASPHLHRFRLAALLGHHAQELLHHARVELAAGVVADVGQRPLARPGGPVGPVRGEGVVDV